MFKLIRFLKPFIGMVILIFALLFVQAMTDLELPDYMSRIVNVGIQQSGVESVVPTAIRASQMDNLQLLLKPEEAEQVMASYRLLDKNKLSRDELTLLTPVYPLLATENIYVLREPQAKTPDSLDTIFSKGLAMLTAIEKGLSGNDPSFGKLPAGTDIFTVLARLTAEQRRQFLDKADQQMAGTSRNMLRQTAISAVLSEYSALGMDTASIQNSYILTAGSLMLLIALLGAVCSVTVGFLAARVAAGVARNLRRAVFTQVENFSNAEFDNFSTASLITRSTNDIQQIQMTLVMVLRILFFAPILGTGGILKVVQNDLSMGWIIAVSVAALMTLVIIMFTVAIPRFKLIQKMIDRLNLVTREILSGLMVIRAFNTQQHQEKKFDEANKNLTRINLFVSRIMVMLMPTMMLIFNGVTLLIVWVGAHQVDNGTMQVGDIMAFMQYTMQIIFSFLMVSMVFIMLPRASVSGQRIAEVLAVKPGIRDPEVPVHLHTDSKGLVEFRKVSFQYPNADDPVLCDISFTALPGQTTAFIGSTGCGKSTLVNLIPRFYDATSGEVLIDGIDIRTVTQNELRQRIGYVPQKGTLFTGDIKSNILYGKDGATDEEIREAAATAQALDFIEASESGFNTPIAQDGTNVSGGQRQRLSIARALVKNPAIYIFDDTFSALDYKTDANLRKALRQYTANACVLIVAQRIGTIMHAEQIIVLENGRIVGLGTHHELLASCPVYQEIASSQLSEEELAL